MAGKPKKYDADVTYEVKLSEPVKIGAGWVRPDQKVKWRGTLCTANDASILEAVLAE